MHTLGSQCVYIGEILEPYHLQMILLNSQFQAYSLQVKSQDAVHTLGSQCVYKHTGKPVKNGPKDDYLLVETCSSHITLCNTKYSRADVQFFCITIRILALRDAFIQMY